MAAEALIGVLGGIQKGGHTDDVLQNAATICGRLSDASSALTDILMWKPFPGASSSGLALKSAHSPLRRATVLTTVWKVNALSAAVSASEIAEI